MNKYSSKQDKTNKQRLFFFIKVFAIICCILGVLGVNIWAVVQHDRAYESPILENASVGTTAIASSRRNAILNLDNKGNFVQGHFQDTVQAANGAGRQIMSRDKIRYGGHTWYILDTKDTKYTNGGIMLFSADHFGNQVYNSSSYYMNSYWEGSPIDQYLNGGSLYNNWSQAERDAMQVTKDYTTDLWLWDGSTTDAGHYDVHGISMNTSGSKVKNTGGKVVDNSSGDHMILLDYYDINNPKYGMYDDSDQTQTYENKVKKTAGFTNKQVGYAAYSDASGVRATYLQQLANAGNDSYFWLRPAGQYSSGSYYNAGALYVNGSGYVPGSSVNDTSIGVRPAFFLNPSSLIYATAVSVAGGVSDASTYSTMSNDAQVYAPEPQDPGLASLDLTYKPYIKAQAGYTNFNTNSTTQAPTINTSSNSITVTRKDNTAATHVVVLLSDKSGNGDVVYQEVKQCNKNTSCNVTISNLPKAMSEYSVTVLLTDSNGEFSSYETAEVYGSLTTNAITFKTESKPTIPQANLEFTGGNVLLATGGDVRYNGKKAEIVYHVEKTSTSSRPSSNPTTKSDFTQQPNGKEVGYYHIWWGATYGSEFYNGGYLGAVQITKKKIATPTANSNLTVTYSGSTYQLSQFVSNAADDEWTKNEFVYQPISGANDNTSTIKNAGTYTVKVSLKNPSNTQWKDGTSDTKIFNIRVNQAEVAKPTSKHSSVPYKPDGYGVSDLINDNGALSNAKVVYSPAMASGSKFVGVGNYTATYTLNDLNHKWKGDTDSNRATTVRFAINKAIVTQPTPIATNKTYNKSTFNENEFVNMGNQGSLFKVTKQYPTSEELIRNAGKYTWTFTLYHPESYQWSKNANSSAFSISFTINKAEVVKPTIKNTGHLPYNKQVQGLDKFIAYSEANGYRVSYAYPNGDHEIKNAGDYTATFTLNDAKNYKWSGMSGSTESNPYPLRFTIDKINSRIDTPTVIGATIDFNGKEQQLITKATYDGESPMWAISTSKDAISSDAVWKSDIKQLTKQEPGDYYIWGKVDNSRNYNATAQKYLGVSVHINDVKVAKITKDPTVPSLTYDGSAKTLLNSDGTAEGGHLEYSLSENSGYSTTIPTAVTAGPHTVWVKVVADDVKYTNSPAKSIVVTIAKAQSVITSKANPTESLRYDGTERELLQSGIAKTSNDKHDGKIYYAVGDSKDGLTGWTTDFHQIKGTNAHTYRIWAAAGEGTNYAASTEPVEVATVTIGKHKINVHADAVTTTYDPNKTNVQLYQNVKGDKLSNGVAIGVDYGISKGSESPEWSNNISIWSKYGDAGEYHLWVRYEGNNDNIEKLPQTPVVVSTIKKAQSEFSTKAHKVDGTIAYDGTAKTLITKPVANGGHGGTVHYIIKDNNGHQLFETDKYEEVTRIDDGTYQVVCSIKGDNNYENLAATEEILVTIDKGRAEAEVVGDRTLKYQGKKVSVLEKHSTTTALNAKIKYAIVKDENINSPNVKWEDNWQAIKADVVGTYYVYAKTYGEHYYESDAKKISTVTITPADVDPSMLGVTIKADGWVFGETEKVINAPTGKYGEAGIPYVIEVSGTSKNGKSVKETLVGNTADTGKKLVLTSVEAGEYTVRYRVGTQDGSAQDHNYKNSAWYTVAEKVVISPQKLAMGTVTITPSSNLEYTGNNIQLISNVTYSGISLNGDIDIHWKLTDPNGYVDPKYADVHTAGGEGWRQLNGLRAGTYTVEYWISRKVNNDKNYTDSEHRYEKITITNKNSEAQYPFVTKPAGNTSQDFTYTGKPQSLLTQNGSATGHDLEYTIGVKSGTTQDGRPQYLGAPDNSKWTTDLSVTEATEAGEYYVYYRIAKDPNGDPAFPVGCVKADMKRAKASVTELEAKSGVAWVPDGVMDITTMVSQGKTTFGELEYSWDGNTWYKWGNAKLNIQHSTTSPVLQYRVADSANWEGVKGSVNIQLSPAIVPMDKLINIQFNTELKYKSGEKQDLINTATQLVDGVRVVGTVTDPNGVTKDFNDTIANVKGLDVLKGEMAGNYVITYHVQGTDKYQSTASKTVVVKIVGEPIDPDKITAPTPIANKLSYNGKEQEVISKGAYEGNEILEYATGNENGPTSAWTTELKVKNAGTYVVWYRVKGHQEHEPQRMEEEVTVEQSYASFVAGKKPMGKTDLVYDGGKQGLLDTNSEIKVKPVGHDDVAEEDIELEYSLDKTTWKSASEITGDLATTYTVYYRIKDGGNYKNYDSIDNQSVKVTIKQAKATVAGAPVQEGELDYFKGYQYQLIFGEAVGNFENVQYGWAIDGQDEIHWVGSDYTQVKVEEMGSYNVYAQALESDNYLASDVVKLNTAPIVIKKGDGSIRPEARPKQRFDLTYDSDGDQTLVTPGKGALEYRVTNSKEEVIIDWNSQVPTLSQLKAKTTKVAGVSFKVYYRMQDSESTKVNFVPVTIEAGTLNARPNITHSTYNGTELPLVHNVEVTGKDGMVVSGMTIEYCVATSNPSAWDVTIPTRVDAKTYTLWYKVSDPNGNYKTVTDSVSVTIEKKTALVTQAPKATEYKYNGEEQDLATGGIVEGGKIVYYDRYNPSVPTEIVPKGINAKSYAGEVLWTVKPDPNYKYDNLDSNGDIRWNTVDDVKIGKAVVYVDGASWVDLDGNPIIGTSFEYAIEDGNAVEYGVKLDCEEYVQKYITYIGDQKADSVGSYTVKFEIDYNNPNVTINAENINKQFTWSITPKTVQAPTFVGEKEYEYSTQGHFIPDLFEGAEANWYEYFTFVVTQDGKNVDITNITNVGDYTITIQPKDSNNIKPNGSTAPVVIKIKTKEVKFTWVPGRPPMTSGLEEIEGLYEIHYYLGTREIPESEINSSELWGKQLKAKISLKSEYVGNIVLDGDPEYVFKMDDLTQAKEVAMPTIANTTLVYNGSEQTFEILGFDSKYMQYVGEYAFTDAGKYTIRVQLDPAQNLKWKGTDSVEAIIFEVEITKANIVIEWDQSTGRPELYFSDKDNGAKGMYDYIYKDTNGNQVQPNDLIDGDEYTIEAVLKADFAKNYQFAEKDKEGKLIAKGSTTGKYQFTCGEVIINQAHEELPIWQLTVGSILIILFLIFMFKSISLSHKVKEEEQGAEEDRTMYSSFVPLGILASLGLLNSQWTIIVIAVAGVTVLMMLVMIWKMFKLKRVKKARRKQADKMQQQVMNMMFGGMNTTPQALQGGAPLALGYGNEDMNPMGQPIAIGYNNNDFDAYGDYNNYGTYGAYDPTYDETYARYAEEEERMRQMIEEQAQALEEMKRKAAEMSAVEATFTPEDEYIAPTYAEYEPEPVITPEPIVTPSPQPVVADNENNEDDVWGNEEEEQEWTMDVDMDITNDDGKYVTKVEKQRVPANFRMRLKMSVVENRHFYEAIKNRLCRGSGVAHRVSGKVEKFRYHEDILVVIGIGKQGLKLWLALDPNQFDSAKYGWQDMSSNPSFAKIPMYIEIHNDIELANALELIDILYDKYAVAPRKKYTDKSNQELIFTLHGNKLAKDSVKKLLLRESVSVGEIDILTNEEAEACEESAEIDKISNPNFASVSISMLEKHYCDGQTVNLESLKKKGLVDADCNGYTVTMGDALSKPLVVEANEFSVGSVKMIILTGGRAVRLTSKN